jgi:hypothetical protein
LHALKVLFSFSWITSSLFPPAIKRRNPEKRGFCPLIRVPDPQEREGHFPQSLPHHGGYLRGQGNQEPGQGDHTLHST